MSWTDERIDTLRKMWEAGQTASQIAEELGGVSRNAVIGKAHRLGLQSRPSPVKPNEPAAAAAPKAAAPKPTPPAPRPPVERVAPPVAAAPVAKPEPEVAEEIELDVEDDADDEIEAPVVVARPAPPILRSVGPGGFLRQAPGEQQAPITPAPPRRLVPAKPSPEMAGKTTLLDLSDKICKWPIGHPGQDDFRFCGETAAPGKPYCNSHCAVAYRRSSGGEDSNKAASKEAPKEASKNVA